MIYKLLPSSYVSCLKMGAFINTDFWTHITLFIEIRLCENFQATFILELSQLSIFSTKCRNSGAPRTRPARTISWWPVSKRAWASWGSNSARRDCPFKRWATTKSFPSLRPSRKRCTFRNGWNEQQYIYSLDSIIENVYKIQRYNCATILCIYFML